MHVVIHFVNNILELSGNHMLGIVLGIAVGYVLAIVLVLGIVVGTMLAVVLGLVLAVVLGIVLGNLFGVVLVGLANQRRNCRNCSNPFCGTPNQCRNSYRIWSEGRRRRT